MFVKVTPEERQRLRDGLQWQENVSAPGSGVVNRHNSLAITPGRKRKRPRFRGVPSEGIWIRITGATPVANASNRWAYSWVEAVPAMYGVWKDKTGGQTSADSGIVAYNAMEQGNGATGILAPGYDVSKLPADWALQPISGNPVVFARFLWNCASELTESEPTPTPDFLELHFYASNTVDGAGCTTPAP